MEAADKRLKLLDHMGEAILEVVKSGSSGSDGFKELVGEVIAQESKKDPPPESERHTEMWASANLLPLDELLQLANDQWVRQEGAALVRAQALEMEEKAHGADSLEAANAANRLAMVLRLKGDLKESEKHTKRALLQFEKSLPSNDRQIAAILNNLASLEAEVLDNEDAKVECEGLFTRARQILEDPAPDPREERQRALYGEVTDQDLLHLERLRKEWKDQDERALSSTISNLADLKRDQSEFNESVKLYGEALEIDLKRLVRNPELDKRQIAEDCSNVAVGMIEAVSDEEAAESPELLAQKLKTPIRIDDASLPPALDEVRALIVELRDAGPRELLMKAIVIEEEIFGTDSYKIAIDRNNLGNLEQKLGNAAAAKEEYTKALEIDKKYFGERHANVATRLNNLGTLLAGQEKHGDAAEYFKQALAIDEEVLGKDHEDVATDLNNLATALGDAGRHDEAKPLYERAIKIAEEAFGEDHPEVSANLNNYAVMLYNMGEYSTAKPLFERALQIRTDKLGEYDEATNTTKEWLDDWPED